MKGQLLPNELIQFFQSYQKGFNHFDALAIASHYLVPATISDADGLRTYLSTQELISKFTENCTSFRQMGYVSAQFSPGLCHSSGDNAATVDLGWSILLENDRRDFRTTYMCVLAEERWKIITAMVYAGA